MTSAISACKLAGVANWLEANVRAVAERLRAKQLARIWKIPDDLMSQVPTPADFFGYTRTARAILIECKIRNESRLELGRGGLKPHQRRALDELNRANGVALLLWGQADEIAVLDPDMIRVLADGRKSIPWKGIPTSRVFSTHELEHALEKMISPETV